MGKDYRKTAEEVLQYIGGKDNIEQGTLCDEAPYRFKR